MLEETVGILYKVADNKSLGEEEKKILADWLSRSERNRRLFEEILDTKRLEREIKEALAYDGRKVWAKIIAGIKLKKANIPGWFNRSLLSMQLYF